MKASKEKINKDEILTKLEAFSVYAALKKANPKIKQDIKKLKIDIIRGLSKHDRKSGVWFANLYKKVIEQRSKLVSLESLTKAYDTQDKEVIAKKLTAYYANYGIAVGAILGASGGTLGFVTAAYGTFGEIACLAYFQLSLIYDLSVLYERPLDKVNYLEVYELLQKAFTIDNNEFSEDKIEELVDKGSKLIKNKLEKADSQKHFQGLLKNLGASIILKSSKNFVAKMVPIFGVISGMLVGITLDFYSVKMTGKKIQGFYESIYKYYTA
jgi:uncharacterized Fe-S cluster-containing protein